MQVLADRVLIVVVEQEAQAHGHLVRRQRLHGFELRELLVRAARRQPPHILSHRALTPTLRLAFPKRDTGLWTATAFQGARRKLFTSRARRNQRACMHALQIGVHLLRVVASSRSTAHAPVLATSPGGSYSQMLDSSLPSSSYCRHACHYNARNWRGANEVRMLRYLRFARVRGSEGRMHACGNIACSPCLSRYPRICTGLSLRETA